MFLSKCSLEFNEILSRVRGLVTDAAMLLAGGVVDE